MFDYGNETPPDLPRWFNGLCTSVNAMKNGTDGTSATSGIRLPRESFQSHTSFSWPGGVVAYSLMSIVLLLGVGVVLSEDKPDSPPRIALAAPFAILPNATTKIIVRGWKLNRDIEAKSTYSEVTLRVLRYDNAGVPNGLDAKLVGDTLVELEITVPQGFASETLPITFVAGGTESPPYSLLVGGPHPVVAEVETNDSFRQAQSISVPQVVDGNIDADRNIDIYAFELASEQKMTFEVIARRQGSGLDSLLTVFDSRKEIVATSDDAIGTDSKIDVTLAAGRYFVVVQDANDHGGVTHPYRLVVQPFAKDN